MWIILHGAYAFTSLIVLILPVVIQSPCPREQYLYQLGIPSLLFFSPHTTLVSLPFDLCLKLFPTLLTF